MKIVFMGTSDFSVCCLKKLLDEKFDVVAVVTQPDKVRGRREAESFSPVKKLALERGVRVLQYEKVSREGMDDLRAIGPDVIVTAAFGQILSEELLRLPPMGVLNVHASLLPKYRGSAPIQWAIICGEKKTGVTIMKTAYKVDSGDMLLTKETDVLPTDTAGTMFDKLAEIGAEALTEALRQVENGTAKFTPQNEAEATHYPRFKKEDGEINFDKTASELDCFVRGVTPWPGAFSKLNGKTFKVFAVEKAEGKGEAGEIIFADSKRGLVVACRGGAVRLKEIQPENGKRMSDSSFLLGHGLTVGDKCGG